MADSGGAAGGGAEPEPPNTLKSERSPIGEVDKAWKINAILRSLPDGSSQGLPPPGWTSSMRRVGSERGTPPPSSAGSCSGGRAKTRFAWRWSTDKDGITRSWQRVEVRRTGRAQGGRRSRGAERATSQLAKLAAGRPARRVRTRVCPHLTGRPPDHCSWTRAVLWRWPRLERMRRRVR